MKAAESLRTKPGRQQDAKKLYMACAEALNKIKQETTDDRNFQEALRVNIAKLLDSVSWDLSINLNLGRGMLWRIETSAIECKLITSIEPTDSQTNEVNNGHRSQKSATSRAIGLSLSILS